VRDALPDTRRRTVVVGLGNAFRGDDAAGLEVARRLGVQAFEGEPVSLIEEWRDVDRLLLVDAMQSGADAGAIRVVAAHEQELPPELRRPSTHLLGVAEAVELARALDRLPRETYVYAIEGERFDAGSGLTPAVAAAVERVVELIEEVLHDA
jgi:hydrogenase maturation protease